MPVTHDNASSASSAGAQTSLTFSHTTSGSDRALGVGVAINTQDDPTSVTYNGVGMAKEVTQDLPVDGDNCSGWELENPASGANNVVVTTPNSQLIVAGAESVNGADQTDCISNSNTATGTSTSPSVTVSSANDEFVFACIMSFGGVSWTPGTGETERWDIQNGGAGTCDGWGGTEAGAASVTINPTQSASQEWGICAMSFRAAGGAPADRVKDPIGCGVIPFAR